MADRVIYNEPSSSIGVKPFTVVPTVSSMPAEVFEELTGFDEIAIIELARALAVLVLIIVLISLATKSA